MAEESISLSESEYRLFKALVQNGVAFVVVGLSAALLQGVPAVTQDIDIWVENLGSDRFLNAVRQAGATYIPPGVAGQNPPLLAGQEFRGIDIVTTCSGLGSISEEIKTAVKVRLREIELLVLPLERIIKSKQAANRAKDQAALPMLIAAEAALRKRD